MNRLENVILNQHERIQAGPKNLDATREIISEMQVEVLAESSPNSILEILDKDILPARERDTLTGQMRAFDSRSSITSRQSTNIRVANQLTKLGVLVERQGYVGGIIIDGDDRLVYGHSMAATFKGYLKQDDPIQEAMGDSLYPSMMWVKALRAEAYKNRPEAILSDTITDYLVRLGLSLGSETGGVHGDISGATGFMPGERLGGDFGIKTIDEHVTAEPIAAFRLSGLCDQSVLDPNILLSTPDYATAVINAGGTIN